MAWPHLEKAKQPHYKTGLDVVTERRGETETPGDMTLRQTSRKQGLDTTTGEGYSGQETLERSCAWPMLQGEPPA